MKPIENGHERRLAGSIFSDYCVDLPALYIEVYIFVRVNGAKPLVNLFQFNRERHRGGAAVHYVECHGNTWFRTSVRTLTVGREIMNRYFSRNDILLCRFNRGLHFCCY